MEFAKTQTKWVKDRVSARLVEKKGVLLGELLAIEKRVATVRAMINAGVPASEMYGGLGLGNLTEYAEKLLGEISSLEGVKDEMSTIPSE